MSEEKKKMGKGKKILVGVGIYLVIVAVAIAIISQTDSWKNAGAEPQPKNAAEKAASGAVALADAPLDERIKFFAKQNDKYNMKDLTVNVGIDGIITIRVLSDGLSDDHLVQRSCSYALDVGQAVFDSVPEVQRIQYLFDAAFIDGLGNENKQKSLSFAFDRAAHAKIDYGNFKPMVMADYNSMWNAVEEVYIHPAVRKNLKKLR